MKLTRLRASGYRSLKDVEVSVGSLNLLIGANASGKSNVLDALRSLADGVRAKDFTECVSARGGILHLAWKGQAASEIQLVTTFEDGARRYEWTVRLQRSGLGFEVREQLDELRDSGPSSRLLEAEGGKVWWWSNQANAKLNMALAPTACALAVASADHSFPAHHVAAFVERWGFFDPSPPILRRASRGEDDSFQLDPSGRGLAARLYTLKNTKPDIFGKILAATRAVLGVPEAIEFRVSEFDDRVYFLQSEQDLDYRIHQVGASSGTLRMLALMTALFGERDAGLVGIEEPENHVHPSALRAFAEYLRDASTHAQILVTTHSPLLLDCLPLPEEVCVVQRTEEGTKVTREEHPEAVKEALEKSGFGLGEFYETKGFGV